MLVRASGAEGSPTLTGWNLNRPQTAAPLVACHSGIGADVTGMSNRWHSRGRSSVSAQVRAAARYAPPSRRPRHVLVAGDGLYWPSQLTVTTSEPATRMRLPNADLAHRQPHRAGSIADQGHTKLIIENKCRMTSTCAEPEEYRSRWPPCTTRICYPYLCPFRMHTPYFLLNRPSDDSFVGTSTTFSVRRPLFANVTQWRASHPPPHDMPCPITT